jgi:hypothetical protein
VCLLGGYGSSGIGFCPEKEKTNLEFSSIITIHHSATAEKFNNTTDNNQTVENL